MCLHACAPACVRVYVCAYVSVSMCVCVCMSVFLQVCPHICANVSVCFCMWVPVYMCVHVCLSVCLHACIFLYPLFLGQAGTQPLALLPTWLGEPHRDPLPVSYPFLSFSSHTMGLSRPAHATSCVGAEHLVLPALPPHHSGAHGGAHGGARRSEGLWSFPLKSSQQGESRLLLWRPVPGRWVAREWGGEAEAHAVP